MFLGSPNGSFKLEPYRSPPQCIIQVIIGVATRRSGKPCRLLVKIQKEREMEKSEKARLTTRVVDLWCSFQLALTESKRKYPVQQFFSFASAVRQYTELTRRDRLVRRDVAVVMNGLLESLQLEGRRVPGEILYEADRLESLFFAGYDPHFEGDEPPGL